MMFLRDRFSVHAESETSAALRRRDFAIIFDWFRSYFLVAAGFGFVLIAVAAWPLENGGVARVLGLSFIFAAGCAICGWVFGLLFGIPRTLARPHAVTATDDPAANAPGHATASSRVNTNLEDISDWLTKTLVGVGLTQLYAVPQAIWDAAGKINEAGFNWPGSGQVLALALFLYFAPGGFWLGYIGTRTMLTKLFDSLEGPSREEVATALDPDGLKIDVRGKISPSRKPEIQRADAAILQYSMTALNTSRELAAWGVAKARNDDLQSATVALQQARRVDPSDKLVSEALAKIYTTQSRKSDARQLVLGDDSEVAMFNALYEDPPVGFEKALKIGTKLLGNRDAPTNLNLHIWLACAYGQQHRYAVKNDDSVLATRARDNVIREVETAIRISPIEAKTLLRSFWLTSDHDGDNDLNSIPHDDPDLSRLLSD